MSRAQAAHDAARERYLAMEFARHEESFEGGNPEWPEDAAGPYCGCEDCVVREVLHAAWPHLKELALAIERGDTDV